jgi:hypothetical protein
MDAGEAGSCHSSEAFKMKTVLRMKTVERDLPEIDRVTLFFFFFLTRDDANFFVKQRVSCRFQLFALFSILLFGILFFRPCLWRSPIVFCQTLSMRKNFFFFSHLFFFFFFFFRIVLLATVATLAFLAASVQASSHSEAPGTAKGPRVSSQLIKKTKGQKK